MVTKAQFLEFHRPRLKPVLLQINCVLARHLSFRKV